MSKPRLVDFFCAAGGASMGYRQAGFEVYGVDTNPQPNYPFEFIKGDALALAADEEFMSRFHAAAGSPTCQRRCRATAWRGSREAHPDHLTPFLEIVRRLSIPYVVENVPEAVWDGTMRADFMLCGTQFGLNVKRHRAFECSWDAFELMPPCTCYRNPRLLPFEHKGERAFADAMGCTWMTKFEARQAIPPAYTEHIGKRLLEQLAVAHD